MSIKNKIVSLLLSSLGFSLAASSLDNAQPEYGVRIQLDYGPTYIDNSFYIKGNIYNKKNKMPVPNANIKLTDENKLVLNEIISDSSGNFSTYLLDGKVRNKFLITISSPINSDIKFKTLDTTIEMKNIKTEFLNLNLGVDEKEK